MFKNYLRRLIDPSFLITVVVFIIIAVFLNMFLAQKAKNFKQSRRKFILLVLGICLVYVIMIFIAENPFMEDDPYKQYILYQVASLGVGSFLVYAYRKYFDKFENESVWVEFLFDLVVALYSTIVFCLVYVFLNDNSLLYLTLTHFICVLIPTAIYHSFNLSLAIPEKIFKTWHFPENFIELAGVSDEEMKDLVVFTLLIYKNEESTVYTKFRAKGPTRIDFGRLFYNFVLDYNYRHPDDEIMYEHPDGTPYEWAFFLQPKWYERTKYVDPDYPLYMNGIEENSVILCLKDYQISLDKKENPQEENQPEEVDFEYGKNHENNPAI